jgi:hypothetical protein
MKKEKVRYITILKTWHNTFSIGFGVGWADDDNTFCLIFNLGLWVLYVGPHWD